MIIGARRLGEAVNLQVGRGNATFLTKLVLTPRLLDLAEVTMRQGIDHHRPGTVGPTT